MTDEDIEQTELVDETTETVLEEPPFLRISSTWPSADGRVETFTLELNLGGEDSIAEVEGPSTPASSAAARSWLIDLVVATIRELRGNGAPPEVLVSGSALQTVLAEHARHIEACDGSCGIRLPLVDEAGDAGSSTVGHPGSDRWTGGDRKDQD